jgi:hypothetical protein
LPENQAPQFVTTRVPDGAESNLLGKEGHPMKQILLISLILLISITIGCSNISVNHDYDHSADFSKYKSYSWVSQPKVKQKNPLVYNRIVDAANVHLLNRGMRQNAANPDFLIAAHMGSQSRINVTDWGYTYHHRGWVSRDIDVYQYQEGTLVMDIIDSGSKELVWRGTATGTIDPNASPETREANIRNAVDKLLKKFPPDITG